MSAIGVTVWLAALVALLVHVLRLVAAGRASPAEPVRRGEVLAFAAALGALAAAAVWLWCSGPARAGDQRLRERGDATASLELRSATFAAAGELRVGFSPRADVELPSSWSVDEAAAGDDVLVISTTGGLRVAPTIASTSTTRIVLRAAFGAVDPRDLARRVERDGCARASTAPVALEGRGVIAALLCRGDRALASLAIEPVVDGIRIWPRVRHGATLGPHGFEIAAGGAVQLGAASGAVPGLDAWAIPAPRGHADVLVAPDELRAPCDAWGASSHAALARPLGAHGCELRLAAVYDLVLVRIAPDLPGLDRRAGWAAAILVLPPLLALLVLAALPRGAIDRRRYARLVALGWLAVALAALAIARLTWAHRIDLLRDHVPLGARTLLAQGLAAACGAALAGLAALALVRGRARVPVAMVAVVGWLAIAATAFVPDVLGAASAAGVLGAGVAAVAVVALAAIPWRPRVSPVLALLGVGLAAVATSELAPRLVAAKLTLAWLVPPLAYLALRAAIGATHRSVPPTDRTGRRRGPAPAAPAARARRAGHRDPRGVPPRHRRDARDRGARRGHRGDRRHARPPLPRARRSPARPLGAPPATGDARARGDPRRHRRARADRVRARRVVARARRSAAAGACDRGRAPRPGGDRRGAPGLGAGRAPPRPRGARARDDRGARRDDLAAARRADLSRGRVRRQQRAPARRRGHARLRAAPRRAQPDRRADRVARDARRR